MPDRTVRVVIVQLAGSPGRVYASRVDAFHEIERLVRLMQADEVPPAEIRIRVGTMSRQAFEALREFEGY